MFGVVTAIIPTGAGATGVATVVGQLTADLPELLAVLFGMFAIGYVLRLLRHWLKAK